MGQKIALLAALGAFGIGALVESHPVTAPLAPAAAEGRAVRVADPGEDFVAPPHWQTTTGAGGVRVHSPIPAEVVVVAVPVPVQTIIVEQAPRASFYHRPAF